jgi:hypothetical protein
VKSLHAWLKARWDAFGTSYDSDEVLAGSDLRGMAITVGSMLLLLALIGYVPPFSDYARFPLAWISIVLTCFGGAATVVAYRTRLKGVGEVATTAPERSSIRSCRARICVSCGMRQRERSASVI